MLGKLIKYELKATSKLLPAIYGAVLLLALINMMFIGPVSGIGGEGNTVLSIVSGLVMGFYILMIVASMFITIIVIIIRFYKHLMGDEGYLMFTLPVTAQSHIISKLISALIWEIVNVFVIIASLMILLAQFNPISAVAEVLRTASIQGLDVGYWMIMLGLLLLFGAMNSILMLYAAMAWGPNLIKNRLGGSIVCYIIFYVANSVISVVVFTLPAMSNMLTEPLFYQGYGSEFAAVGALINDVFMPYFWITLCYSVVLSAVYFFITRYMLTKKLNLA